MSSNMPTFINFYSQRSLKDVSDNEKNNRLIDFINNLFEEYIPCKNQDSNYSTNCKCLSKIRDNGDNRISLDNS